MDERATEVSRPAVVAPDGHVEDPVCAAGIAGDELDGVAATGQPDMNVLVGLTLKAGTAGPAGKVARPDLDRQA